MGSDHSYGGHDRSLITPLTSTMSWGRCGWPCRMALSKIMNMHPATSSPATSSLGLKSEHRTAGTPPAPGSQIHDLAEIYRGNTKSHPLVRREAVGLVASDRSDEHRDGRGPPPANAHRAGSASDRFLRCRRGARRRRSPARWPSGHAVSPSWCARPSRGSRSADGPPVARTCRRSPC
jgi:hypothetical protein